MVWTNTCEGIGLDLRKTIVYTHKTGEKYKKLSKRFHVSRIGVRNTIMFKERQTLQKKVGL